MRRETGTNSAGLPFDVHCSFCGVEEHRCTPKFKGLYGFPQETAPMARKLRSSALLMDEMPLTEGHLLLVPNGHYTSANLVENRADMIADAVDSMNFLRKVYPNHNLIAFEHGSGMTEGVGVSVCGKECGVGADHTHIHMMPVTNPLEPDKPLAVDHGQVRDYVEDLFKLSGWENPRDEQHYRTSPDFFGALTPDFVTTEPYIWFHIDRPDGSKEESTFKQTSLDEKLPSQVMRRSVAPLLYGREVETTKWDYHELRWRIFVDQFDSDVPYLAKLVNGFKNRHEKLLG